MTDLETAFAECGEQLDRIIDAYERKGPEPSGHPETIIRYSDESTSSFNIIGEINYNTIPNIDSAIELDIGNTVTSIAIGAFDSNHTIEIVSIPYSLTSIGDFVFTNCNSITNFNVDENNPIYDSRNQCNAIIKTENNELVYGCQNTVIPNTVTSIKQSAFIGQTQLSSITIPNGVTSIGNYAFSGCSGLTSVTILDSVTSIGDYAFRECPSLASVTIGNGVTSIGDSAFFNCPATVTFEGKNKVTVQGMTNFRWDIGTNKIVCTDGTL